jgi:hypothetical protein
MDLAPTNAKGPEESINAYPLHSSENLRKEIVAHL